MKGLKKLVLATAVAAAPFAQAELTAMDDSFLEGMTGQAGITLDMNLDMTIGEIRYVDEDGASDLANDGGYLSLSNISIYGDQGNGTQAEIRGVTIDVDGTEGIKIGFGEIGGTAIDQTDAASIATTSAMAVGGLQGYWTGVNIDTDFGINGATAGSLSIKNFTNFVPNALALEGVKKFGYTLGGDLQLTANDSGELATIGAALGGGIEAELTGGVTAATATEAEWGAATQAYMTANPGFAVAVASGDYVDASVSITAGGADGQGLGIDAVFGFVIEEMSFSDDGRKMGIHNFTMYDTDATGEITGFTVTGLKIDVVDFATDGFVATNSSATAALKLSGLNTSGTIAMGDIFIGDHVNGSIGALSIKDINMSNTEILIYGH